MAPSRGMIRALARHSHHTRSFGTVTSLHSGHNRWSKIKHDKGKADAVKNRNRSAFAQEIATASKLFGPERSTNPKLADLVSKAKKEGFSKTGIEAAIARGQGRSTSGASLESVTVEGILPNNVAVIVECETESKLKTLAGVRLVMKDAGGSSTPCSYLFDKRGRVIFERKDGVSLDEALDAALEAGATDVEETEDGGVVVYCEPNETKRLGEAMGSALDLAIKTSDILWSPKSETQVALSDESQAEELGSFVDELLDKENSIQAVSMNVAQGSATEETWKELQSRLSL